MKILCHPEGPGRFTAEDYVESVTEYASCVYEMIVHSRRLCKIDYFNMKPAIVNQIMCNPASDVPALRIYHEELKREKEDMEKKNTSVKSE